MLVPKLIKKFSFFFSKIDLFIGGLEENLITAKNLIASQAYYHDTLVWCVEKSKQSPMWLNLFHLISSPIINTSVGVSRELILSHAGERRNRQDDIYCFEHSNIIFEHPLSLLTPIDFPLLNELNSFIERANENGLIINWLNRYGTFRDRRNTFHTENFVYVAEDANPLSRL